MERVWSKKLPIFFAVCGGICLIGSAVLCAGLDRGGYLDHIAVALAMLLMAAIAVVLLRLEKISWENVLVMLLPIGIAVLVRTCCLEAVSSDYQSFLGGWYQDFYWNGGFKAIAMDIGNYNVPYMYFMAAISYISIPDLYTIKLFSIFFDVVLAWGGFRLVRVLRGKKDSQDRIALLAFALMLLLPTVVLNGSYWAQCDAIYGALVVHAIALVLEGKNKSSVALLAVAFSFKLQTVFLMPLWGVLWLAKRVKFRQLWVFPGVSVITIIPALLLGKPLGDILGVYFGQMGEYPRLTLNAPSIYQYVPYGTESGGNHLDLFGIAAAAILVLILLGVGLKFGRRLDRRAVMAIAVVMAVGIPFFLPHMHERYFFLADVASVCLACVDRKGIPAAILVNASSLASYRVFLRLKFNWTLTIGGNQYGMPIEATVMLAALVCSVVVLVNELKRCAAEENEVEIW